MHHCSNHLNCCHKVQAWVQEEYFEKKNRSPYRQRSFQNTLRTYAPSAPLKSLPKSKNLYFSRFGLKQSRWTTSQASKENIENNENRQTESTPIDALSSRDKNQNSGDHIVFKQIQQSQLNEITPFHFILPLANDFEKVVFDEPKSEELLNKEQAQNSTLLNQGFTSEDKIALATPLKAEEEVIMEEEPLISKRQAGRKFSLRLIKKQFKHLWSRKYIEQLTEAIIRTRELCEIGEEAEIKAKLYCLLLSQLP